MIWAYFTFVGASEFVYLGRIGNRRGCLKKLGNKLAQGEREKLKLGVGMTQPATVNLLCCGRSKCVPRTILLTAPHRELTRHHGTVTKRKTHTKTHDYS